MQEKQIQENTQQKKIKQPRFISRILWFEVPWLILLGPSILLTEFFWEPEYRLFFIGYLFIFWPVRLLAQHGRLLPGISGWPIYLLLVGTVIGVTCAENTQRALEGAAYIVYGVVVMVALANWRPVRRQPRLLLIALAAVALPLAILGPELFSVNPRKLFDVYNAKGALLPATMLWEERINPNIMAGTLVPLIPLFAALSLWSSWHRRPWLPLLSIVTTALMGNALILSQSRGGYMAVAGGLTLLLILRWPRLLYVLPVLLVGTLIALVTAVIDAPAISPLLSQAFVSLEDRILLWQIGWEMFQSSSFMGIGAGQFDLIVKSHFPEHLPSFFNSAPPHAHSILIQVGLDSGILGLLGSVILFGLISYRLFGRLIRSRSTIGWPEMAGTLSGFFALFIFGLFDIANWGTKLEFVPGLLLAFAIIVVNYDFNAMD